MPVLRQREQALRAELQSIADQTNDRAAFLRLAETLTAFLARLRSAAETLSVTERQRIVRFGTGARHIAWAQVVSENMLAT